MVTTFNIYTLTKKGDKLYQCAHRNKSVLNGGGKVPQGFESFSSYRKIYEEINPVENGQSKHAMIDSFAGGPPTALDRAGPIQNQEFSVPNVKTGKYKSDIQPGHFS